MNVNNSHFIIDRFPDTIRSVLLNCLIIYSKHLTLETCNCERVYPYVRFQKCGSKCTIKKLQTLTNSYVMLVCIDIVPLLSTSVCLFDAAIHCRHIRNASKQISISGSSFTILIM